MPVPRGGGVGRVGGMTIRVRKFLRRVPGSLGVLTALAVAAALRATVSVSLPILAAALIALAVWPLVKWVRARMPDRLRWLGVVAAMLVVVAVLVLFLVGLVLAATQVANGIDQFGGQAQAQLQQKLSEGRLGAFVTEARQLAGGAGNELQQIKDFARGLLFALWRTLAGVGLILLFVLLMLTDGDAWSVKLGVVAGGGDTWRDAATAVGQRFRDYFLATLGVGTATGLLYLAYLSAIGLRFAFVFALLGGLGNFIPSLGAVFTVALPTLFALAMRDPQTALLVFVGLGTIEIVMGNVVQPLITGDRLAISPLVVIASLLVWSWIWGAAGALLAVPMTALLMIVLAHIDALKPVALMLSDKRGLDALDDATRAR